MVENLRKEMYAKFSEKDDVSKLKKRIDDLQENVKVLDEESRNHEHSLNQCRDITDTNKVDIDELKRKLGEMDKKIGGLGNNRAPVANIDTSNLSNESQLLSAFDEMLQKLRELEEKVD